MKHFLGAGILALSLGIAPSMQAAILFNNGAPDQISGDNMSEALVADDFTIGGLSDITNLRFWSVQSDVDDYEGSVYWAIHSDAAGLPGGVLFSGTFAAVANATGNSTGFGYDEYVFDIPVAFQLGAGTYWLALHNGPLNNGVISEMLWATTNPGNGTFGSYIIPPDGSGPWVSTLQEHAFLVEGDRVNNNVIPEPSTFVLLSGGIAVAALMRRRGLGR